MNPESKQTALRMIPYGLYVLTAETEQGDAVASTVCFVSQTSIEPPLIITAIKRDSHTFKVVSQSNLFALNILGKDQMKICTKFYTARTREGNTIGGEDLIPGRSGVPLLASSPAYLECRVDSLVDIGDHPIFIAEVIDAGVREQPIGRPDESALLMKDLGPKAFYGG